MYCVYVYVQSMCAEDVCMYSIVCMYDLYVYVCTYICMYVPIYSNMYVRMYIRMYVCMYVCMYAHA